MDVNEPVTVYTVTNPVEAELVRSLLKNEGIRCMLGGMNTGELALPGASDIDVMVPADEADRARKILERHDEERARNS